MLGRLLSRFYSRMHEEVDAEVDAMMSAEGAQFRGGVPVCGVCGDRADDLSICDQCGEGVCYSCLFRYRRGSRVSKCCWEHASEHSALQLKEE